MPDHQPSKKFDAYVQSYEHLHDASISASGEESTYFHEYKIDCIKRLGIDDRHDVFDYGCGIGNLVERLVSRCHSVSGYDPSSESLDLCHERAPGAMLYPDISSVPSSAYDVVLLSCVLHHVVPDLRRNVMNDVMRILKPGGRVVIFEHNPWNPVTLHAVGQCEFDDDAILLSSLELRALLRGNSFEKIRTDYIVFFPKFLSALRPIEPMLSWCPLGAQTMTVGYRAKE